MLSKELNLNDKYKNKKKVLGRKEELEITVGASFDGDTQPLLVWPIYEFFRGNRFLNFFCTPNMHRTYWIR